MSLFPANRALLFPQFETYRLQSLDQDDAVFSYTLPAPGATQSRVGYATSQHQLSFKEVRARIAWDHLAVGTGGRGVYVDAEMGVVGIMIDADLQATFTQLATLPRPIGSSSTAQHPEYPSVKELDETHWAVSCGSGSLYVVETSRPSDPTFTGTIIAKYELQLDSRAEPAPFLIQAVQSTATTSRLLLSRSVPPPPKEKGRAQTEVYELLEVSIDPTRRNEVDEGISEKMRVSWRVQGGDLPAWCTRHGEGWIILSGETYTVNPDSDYGVVTSNENVEKATESSTDETSQGREWPYSWTQTAEAINMKLQLPPAIVRRDINVILNVNNLALSINESTSDLSPALSRFLKTALHTFWAGIDISESTWTFDPATSILNIELYKTDENTRWPSIFLPRDEEDEIGGEDMDEGEVPETFSPEMMASVRATLDNIRTRQLGEPEGAHPSLPGLVREEMDYEFDDDDDGEGGALAEMGGGSKVGRDVFVGYLENGNGTWSKASSSVLSVAISGDGHAGVIVKSGMDGLLFNPNVKGDPGKCPWQHSSSSPALSFVLSSKRDLRLVRHLSEDSGKTTVLAFESGASIGASNLYVYYPPTSATIAGQGVVGVCGGQRGALLGVGCVNVAGRQVILALCENELVVLHGIL